MGRLGQLNTAHFLVRLKRYGKVPLAWYRRAGACPRDHVGTVTGFRIGQDPTCPMCGGTGELMIPMALPVSGLSEGKVLLYGALIGKAKSPIQEDVGDLQVSFLAEDYPFGEGDRIVLPSREKVASEEILRGSGSKDRLRYPQAKQVLSVYKEASSLAAGAVTSGYALSDNGTTITWSSGITAGEQYAIAYVYRPTYEVVAGSLHLRETATDGSQFPSHLTMRLWEWSPVDRNANLALPSV
jgi:hypothetical protein